MRRSVIPFVVAVSALALVTGCVARQEAEQALPGSWAGLAARDPAPTGITLAGAPAANGSGAGVMAADGGGSVWVKDPLRLTRLDPATGQATTWDAADDAAFSARSIAPSSGTGVWLIRQHEAHLFNGSQFLADLAVPEDVLQSSPGGTSAVWVDDVVESGSTLWLSLVESVPGDEGQGGNAGRVLRWSDGQWTQVAAIEDGVSGSLAVDTQGAVWAGGMPYPPVGVEPGIKRWDGTAWTIPGADDAEFPRGTGTVIADPTGGVWFLELTGGPIHLSHFDGTSWHLVNADVGAQVGEGWAIDAFTASSAGDAWLAGSSAVVRFGADGTTQAFGPEQGATPDYGAAPTMTVAGDDVLLHQLSGVLRLDGERFTQLWKDDTRSSILWYSYLTAVSGDEVWIQAQRPGEATRPPDAPEGMLEWPRGWARYRDGGWEQVGPDTTGMCPAALATDGSVWAATNDGLMRVTGDGTRIVAPSLPDCAVLTGPGGSVWVLVDGDVVRIDPDGTRTSIGRPDGFDGMGIWATGPEGSVWVGAWVNGSNAFARWDGSSWTQVEVPNSDALISMAVSDDGAAWGAFLGMGPEDPVSAVGRYSNGTWTFFRGYPQSVDAVPGGRACAFDRSPDTVMICYDAAGEVARHAFDELDPDGYSIAPDGAVWVLGGQVARMPWTVSDE